MKKYIYLILLCILMFVFLGAETQCTSSSAETKQKKQTDKLLDEINSQLGLPAIKNFQEKKLAKMIFELRDQENLICYAYIVNLYGELIFIGKCIGFGLPYSVQYTNPEKYTYEGGSLPQADPNGLYMPQGLSATWLMLIDKKTGEPRPVYIEPQIIVSPFPLK